MSHLSQLNNLNNLNNFNEPLLISPVFKGLTRHAQLLGVDYHYVIFSGIGVFLLFINLKNFLVLLLAIPLHFLGWILCQMDPHIFKILKIKAQIGVIRNKSIWHCQSYEAF